MMYILQLLFALVLIATTNADNALFDTSLERVEIAYINLEYWNVEYKVSKINRTTVGFSMNGTIFKEMSTGLFVDGTLYAFLSNQYKRTAAAYSNADLCRLITRQRHIIEKNVLPYGLVPKSCPIKPGFYYLKDFVMSSDSIENTPWDRVMLEGNVSYRQVKILSGRFYLKFDRDIVYRRPFMSTVTKP